MNDILRPALRPGRHGDALWRALRPPFLTLSLVCVTLGVALAHAAGAVLVPAEVAVVLLGALAAHGSVNLFNEFEDARSGLDQRTIRTPFSGGSGALQDDPGALPLVRHAAWGLFGATLVVGAWAMWRHGALVAPLGLAGLALVLLYTPALNRHPWLCLIAPGLGVGPLMVLGTVAVLAGRIDAVASAAAGVPGLLGSALLLANQFPDVEADRSVGRRHLAITHGRTVARRVYVGLASATALLIGCAVLVGAWPPGALAALPALAPMILTARGLARHGADPARLGPALAANVVAVLLTPLVLAWALW